jgi:hypothetical protein
MRSQLRALLVLVTIACARQPVSDALFDVHSSDQAVYRAVLDSMFVPRTTARVTQLVILDSTSTLRRENLVPGVFRDLYRLPEVDSAAVHDFEARNLEAHSLKYLPDLRLGFPIVLVNRASLRSLPRGDPDKYWSQFYQKYPGASGSISFSAIGYGANGNVALLMVDQGCGSLCGAGYNVVVKREGSRWRVVAVQQTWVF